MKPFKEVDAQFNVFKQEVPTSISGGSMSQIVKASGKLVLDKNLVKQKDFGSGSGIYAHSRFFGYGSIFETLEPL